jgi:UMF1 family MFS transporter
MVTDTPLVTLQADKSYNRQVSSWAWYDWANHAYITTTASAFFPPYFIAIAAAAFLPAGGSASDPAALALARDTASNVFALMVSLALFVAAILAPVVGAYADITGQRKRLLITATVVASLFSSLMVVLTTGMWVLGLGLYFITQVAMNIALGSSSSLLPHVSHPDDINRVSSLGYAMGYVGGGLLLALNTALFLFSDKLGIDSSLAVRIAFFTVGLWWMGFSIPMILNVAEPPGTPLAHGSRGNPLRDSFTRLANTVRDAARYREMFKMLLAFWFYMEGIGAIILLATSYGAALGLDTSVLISTLLMTQFVAFPYALMFGRIPVTSSRWRTFFISMLLWTAVTFPLMGLYANLSSDNGNPVSIPLTFALIGANQVLGLAFSYLVGRRLFAGLVQRLTTKRAVIVGLLIYTLIPLWGFVLKSQAEFFMIGWLVGTVQGGTQALSRSIYATLTPRAKSGEFFGLYGLSEKFAGILGPLLYGVVGTLTHNPRASIFSISLFFLAGILILWRVDEQKGAQIASAEEAQIEVLKVAD